MSNFVTLSCPSCGGKLQVTNDLERFACGYCGSEHIVRRSGGTVSLEPVLEKLDQLKSGVDRTASELAIQRLRNDIRALKSEHVIIGAELFDKFTPLKVVILLSLGGVISLVVVAVAIGFSVESLLLTLLGVAFFAVSYMAGKGNRYRRNRTSVRFAQINAELSQKQTALRDHENLVDM